MDFTKKFALVPADNLHKHIPSKEQLNDFDKEMHQILYSKKPEDEKIKLYYDLLRKKINIEENNTPWKKSYNQEPAEMDSTENMEDISKNVISDSETFILNSVPKHLKNQCKNLFDILSKYSHIIKWNDKLELIYKNNRIPNSNVIDLFNLIFTNRKSTNVIGKQEFLNALGEINMPKYYIKNKNLLLKDENFVASKKKKKSTMSKWLSLK